MASNLLVDLSYGLVDPRIRHERETLRDLPLAAAGCASCRRWEFSPPARRLAAPQDPNELNLGAAFRPPFWQAGGSLEHHLGTDNLGRDILSRIIVGARVSVIVSFYAILFSGAIGTLARHHRWLLRRLGRYC